MPVKHNIEEIRKIVLDTSTSILLSETYTGTYDKMRFRCSCGNEFLASWHQFGSQNKRTCEICSKKRVSEKRRHSMAKVKDDIEKTGCKYISGEYINKKSKLRILCRCGHEKTCSYDEIVSKTFSGLCNDCLYPYVHGVNRLTINEVREYVRQFGLELLSTEYKNMKDPLVFKCSCGSVFSTNFDTVKNKGKITCDVCSQKTSSGERIISEWLDSHKIRYEKQKGFNGLRGHTGRKYKFDFYIRDKNLCIEYDGQQHSKIVNFSGKTDSAELTKTLWLTQIRDAQKNIFCNKNGIELLRIKYTDFDKIDEILTNKLIPR